MFDVARIITISVLPLAALAAAPRGLIPGKQATPETIQLRKIDQPAPPPEPGWGEPIEGVSLRLGADRTFWSSTRVPALTLDLQNQGAREFTTFQLQETGTLEADGIWYEWLGPGVWHRSPFPPGKRFEGIPVTVSADWYPKQDKAVNAKPPPYRPLRLAKGPHTLRFAINCTDANAPSTKTIRKAGEPSTFITAISNPVKIEIGGADEAPGAIAARWGSAAEGLSVLLQAEHTAWTVEDAVMLRTSVRNEGTQDFTINAAQELGELEIDGILYQWAGDIDVLSSTFPPGRRYDNIPVSLLSSWKSTDRKPLQLVPGRHTLRFAMFALPKESRRRSQRVRGLSNPVQIDLAPGIRERAELVRKYLPGCALQAVRGQNDDREFMAEILSMPGGQEIDLASARQEWRGSKGYWENPKLNSIVPSLKARVTNLQSAEDTARIIFGLFKGMYSFSNRAFKGEPLDNGWAVTTEYVGPPAQVPYLGPMELIVENGVLKAVREKAGAFP